MAKQVNAGSASDAIVIAQARKAQGKRGHQKFGNGLEIVIKKNGLQLRSATTKASGGNRKVSKALETCKELNPNDKVASFTCIRKALTDASANNTKAERAQKKAEHSAKIAAVKKQYPTLRERAS